MSLAISCTQTKLTSNSAQNIFRLLTLIGTVIKDG